MSGLGPSAGVAVRWASAVRLARPGMLAPPVSRTRQVAVVLAAVALLVAGCSGDEPAAQPPEQGSPSTSPVATTETPVPEPPELPEAARRNTKAGAVAFAHFYVRLVNHAALTGDVVDLLRYSGPGCESCENTISTIKRIYGHGGSISRYGWHITRYNAMRAGKRQVWLLGLGITADAHTVRESETGELQRLSGGSFTIAAYPAWRDSTWLMTRMDRPRE